MRLAACLVALGLLTAACGDDDAPPRATDARASATPAPSPPPRERPTVARARCPANASNCAAVTGRVIYVEAVDPDGDGDAHYVLAGGRVTAPGISAIDVGRDLRPRRLPRTGELVSAAGPVFRGSHGQRQIQAVELHHQRPR